MVDGDGGEFRRRGNHAQREDGYVSSSFFGNVTCMSQFVIGENHASVKGMLCIFLRVVVGVKSSQ
jgi:hypothetical protein